MDKNTTGVKPFRWFYCQKVLPAVFDDSLSYVELLYKFLHKLNEVIETLNNEVANQDEIIAKIDEAKAELEALIDSVKKDLEAADDNLQKQIDDNYQEHETALAKLNLLLINLQKLYDKLQDEIEHIVANMKIYDPTKGKFTNSIDANRRMLQVLATPADEVLNCTEVGKLTADTLKSYKCGELINSAFKRNIEIPYQNTTIKTDVNIYKLTKVKLTTAKLGEAPELVSEVNV